MAAYLLGVLLFAVGIAVTIALHELGHLLAARACGMRVRRYFIGFGPKVWSITKGHTEYGLKALPFGGFCDIAGMTSLEELTEEEAAQAMIHHPRWQRIIVLLGGIIVNLLVGFIVLYGVATTAGLPNTNADRTAVIGELSCVSTTAEQSCSGMGPAEQAGLHIGDRVTAVNGEAVADFLALRTAIQQHPGESVTLTVERNGESFNIPVAVGTAVTTTTTGEQSIVGVIGVASAPIADAVKQYSPTEAVGATLNFSGQVLNSTLSSLASFPAKIPGVVAAIFGAERDADSPMSVVGASRAGGELVERDMWSMFFMLLASLNFFLALFNLIPLPPFDGGHVAVIIYELLRDAWRRIRGQAPAGPADYTRLLPVTYVIAAILVTLGAVFVVADVVNPVRLFN